MNICKGIHTDLQGIAVASRLKGQLQTSPQVDR